MATKTNLYVRSKYGVLQGNPIAVWTFDNELTKTKDLTSLMGTSAMGYVMPAYNTEQYPAYVVSGNNELVDKMQIAYGSTGSKHGSVIVPAFGFLNSNGKYKNYTLETWVKLKKPLATSGSNTTYKLIGNLNSETDSSDDGNGLYYNSTSFILRLGSKTGKAYVKQFNKPILIQLSYTPDSASLIINGEERISIKLEQSDIDLLASTAIKDYIMIQKANIDVLAIYPYRVTAEQAKLRYAIGQSANVPEVVNKEYGATTVAIDFPSSKFASNLKYPGNAEWKNADSDNIQIKDYSILNNQYELPLFNFATKTLSEFTSDAESIGNTWNPKQSGWESVASNIEFQDMSEILAGPVKGFFADFYTASPPTSEKTIFKIIDSTNDNYLNISIKKDGSTIHTYYRFKYNSTTEQLVVDKTDSAYLSSSVYYFLVGLDIDKFAKAYNRNLLSFFNNASNLTVFAMGDNDLTIDKTPNVTINSIKFLTSKNLSLRSSIINTDGTFKFVGSVMDSEPTKTARTKFGSYELRFNVDSVNNVSYLSSTYKNTYGYFTIASSGYWKSDAPLKYFAKTIKGATGQPEYTFDFLQFNIDYDAPVVIDSSQRFNALNSSVRTYITFEPITSPYKPDSDFTNILLNMERVVIPATNYSNKWELVDGTIIYAPTFEEGKTVSDYTAVIHLDFDVADTVNNLIEIKSLELMSQAMDYGQENPITTKYGTPIIPYTYTVSEGIKTYNYKAYNPYMLEKQASTHLQLERLSGIRLVGFDQIASGVFRGLRVKLNDKLNLSYNVSAIQMFLNYDAPYDPSSNNYKYQFESKEIFKVTGKDKEVVFTATAGVNSETVTISAVESIKGVPSSFVNENILYYVNGKLTTTPTIKTNEWTVLAIVFTNSISLGGTAGAFDYYGPFAIDNINVYQFKDINILNNTVGRPWENVKSATGTSSDYTWGYWNTTSNGFTWTWDAMSKYLDPNNPGIELTNAFSMYLGTNIIQGPVEYYGNLALENPSYRAYEDYSNVRLTYTKS